MLLLFNCIILQKSMLNLSYIFCILFNGIIYAILKPPPRFGSGKLDSVNKHSRSFETPNKKIGELLLRARLSLTLYGKIWLMKGKWLYGISTNLYIHSERLPLSHP